MNTEEEYNSYMDWIKNILNPERIQKGFNPICDTEALFCWNIIQDFSKQFDEKESSPFKLKDDIYKPDFGYTSPRKIKGVKECLNPAFKDHRLHRIGLFKAEYSDGSNGMKGWSVYMKCTMCGENVKQNTVFYPDNQ